MAYNLMRLTALVFISVSILNVLFAFPGPGSVAEFTTYGPAMELLFKLGFVGLTLIAALYHIFPRLAGVDLSPTMTRVQTMAIVLGLIGASLPTALGGLMSGDAVLGSGFYFASLGNLFIFVGSLILFLNFLGAIRVAMKNCDCFASLFGKDDTKEASA